MSFPPPVIIIIIVVHLVILTLLLLLLLLIILCIIDLALRIRGILLEDQMNHNGGGTYQFLS